MDKKNVVCLYNGTLFSNEKEWTIAYNNMDASQIPMLSEKSQTKKEHILYNFICIKL